MAHDLHLGESRRLPVAGGMTAHYRELGAGAPLLMLHGANVSLEAWAPVADRLATSRRVVLLDLPGHGRTEAPPETATVEGCVAFVATVVAALELPPGLAMAGHSMGGHVAWRYALDHTLCALILVAPGGLVPPGGPQGPGYRIARLPGGRLMLDRLMTRERLASGLRSVVADPSVITDTLLDAFWADGASPAARAARFSRFRAPTVCDAAVARLPSLAPPTLTLWGRDDTVFPAGLAARLPGERRVYDACGHFPLLETPDAVAADIVAFLGA